MSVLPIQLGVSWHVLTPPTFRYLEQQYIDAFFNTGALRLSSFGLFAQHADEARQDAEEAHSRFSIGGKGGMIYMEVGVPNAYVLCASTIESASLMTAFSVNGYFRIDDSLGFAAAVAHKIPWFNGGFEGHCLYVDKRHLVKEEDGVLEKARTPEGTHRADQVVKWVDEIGMPRMLFMKPRTYSAHAEYRFIWQTARDTAPYIDVASPEAVQFCTRVT